MTTDIIRDGEGVRVLEDGRAVRIVADKSRLRVPMIAMDGKPVLADLALHRPGFRLGTGDTKANDAAYADYVGNLETAWRKPTTDAPAAKPAPTANAREAAYQSMVGDLESAWKGAST